MAYPKHVSLILLHVEGGELQSRRVIPASAGTGGRPRAGQGLALGPTCAEMKVNAGMSQFTLWDGSIFQGSWIIPATQVHGAHCHGGSPVKMFTFGEVWAGVGSWCFLPGSQHLLLGWHGLQDTDIISNRAQFILFCAG